MKPTPMLQFAHFGTIRAFASYGPIYDLQLLVSGQDTHTPLEIDGQRCIPYL